MKQLSLEAFIDACGGPGPLCLDVTSADDRAPRRQVLNQPFALVGRHARADIPLNDSSVSRRHALLHLIAGRVFCLDLGSRTGTHWDEGNGGHGWLPGESPFLVGPYRLSLAHECINNSPLTQDGWDPWANGSLSRNELPACTLDISNNGTAVCRWQMNRVLAIVGSSSVCKVRLRGRGVSPLHCALICTPAGVWVVDLQRRGGIEVNHTAVGHSLLEDGDVVQVGSFTIRLSYDSASVHAPVNAFEAGVRGNGGGRRTGFELLPPNAEALHGQGLLPARVPASGALSGDTCSAELLSSVLRQFSETQRHMFDQSLVMMYQMFQAMHKEQLGTLRAEMERLEELNAELRTLLDYRLKGPAVAPLTPIAGPPVGTHTANGANTHRPAAPRGSTAPTVEVKPPAPTVTAPAAAEPRRTAPNPTNPTTTASPSSSPASATDDIHVWLCQRMEAIHTERQGLLKRIVGVLKG